MRRSRPGPWWLVGLVLVTACGGFGRHALRPARPTTASELMDQLSTRRAAVTSLRARIRLRSGLARVWTRQAILVQRPAAIRIDVLSPFGLALALGTEGRTLWAFPPREGVRYEGPASPANFARLVGTPLAVGDLVDVFLGVPPERRPLVPPTLERDGAEYVLTIPFSGGTQLVRFAADTLVVTSAEERRDADPTPLKVTFGDYADGIAHALDLDAGRGGAVSVVFDDVEANAAIDPSVFGPPAASRVLPLDRAAAPS